LGALPVFSRIEALITREDLVKGVIVESTTQSEHFVAVDDIPPRARAFHSHMADEELIVSNSRKCFNMQEKQTHIYGTNVIL
jgi:hypothetical protein